MHRLCVICVILIAALFTTSLYAQTCEGFHNTKTNQCYPMTEKPENNVFGKPLKLCCNDPVTGFYRNGFCQTGREDVGTHVACAIVTDEFLQFSKARGNDLITPRPEYNFPGLKDGDGWCLCALRWKEAYDSGVAPPLNLNATHEKMLDFVPLETLKTFHKK